MPIEFACPHCQKEIRVLETGPSRTTVCPACQATVPVPASAGSGPGSTASYADAWSPPSDYIESGAAVALSRGWRMARRGLGVLQLGGWIFVATTTVSFLFGLLGSLRAISELDGFPMPMLIPMGFAMVAAVGLVAIGLIECCFAPQESKLRGYAFSAFLAYSADIGVSVIVELSAVRSGPHRSTGTQILVLGLALLSYVVFSFYIKGVSSFFADQRLKKSVRRWLLFLLYTVAGGLGIALLLGVIASGGSAESRARVRVITTVVTLGAFGASYIGAIWYLRLLGAARSCIQPRVAPGRSRLDGPDGPPLAV
jgi:hypothetical protein